MPAFARNSARIVVFVLTFLWKFEVATCIVCYDCNSEYDSRCGANFDPYSLGTVNCSLRDAPEGLQETEPTLCRVIKMEIYGKTRVVRSCGYIRDAGHDDHDCQRKSGTHDLFTTYCSCSEDLCNGGAGVEARVAAVSVTAAVTWVAVKCIYFNLM